MPSFSTPQPISVTIDLPSGDVRLTASERVDTVVEVRPSSTVRSSDVRTAEQTRVEYSDGALVVKAPEERGLFGRNGSIDVAIALPAGSHVRGEVALGDFHAQGRLGECHVRVACGDIQVEQTGKVWLDVSEGDIAIERAAGPANLACSSGDVRVRAIDGTATVKNSNGESWIGDVAGDLQVSTANGDISVDRAQAGVRARTGCGDIRVGEVMRGAIVLETSTGDIDVGVRMGSAAWLDVSTRSGDVHNMLDAADGPGDSAETVELRARTATGDIAIRRA